VPAPLWRIAHTAPPPRAQHCGVLHDFLTANREALIDRCKAKVALRLAPDVSDVVVQHGIPQFLDQLIKTLQMEQTADPMRSREVSGVAGGEGSAGSEMGATATQHARELFRRGYTINHVVHDYGDLCQAITDLAFEHGADFEVDEFRTLNRCLDNAIAGAVFEFAHESDAQIACSSVDEYGKRLGFFAHELRNFVATAMLAVAAIKAGSAGLGGATGAVLDRSLTGLRDLIDLTLDEVRVTAVSPVPHTMMRLADLVTEAAEVAKLEAKSRGCTLQICDVDRSLMVGGDRAHLLSALRNVLQNGCKYTHPGTVVSLEVSATADRILVYVGDRCGGLPAGHAETLFRPYSQLSGDKSGVGLGLSISRRAVEAEGGSLSVCNVPGVGCVFTIDLPRRFAEQDPALVVADGHLHKEAPPAASEWESR
jgi:signal transduction histidine kinase